MRTPCGAATAKGKNARLYRPFLLRGGFTVRNVSPHSRWALTPPFHPCLWRMPIGGFFSVALSLALRRQSVRLTPALQQPGLSSGKPALPWCTCGYNSIIFFIRNLCFLHKIPKRVLKAELF